MNLIRKPEIVLAIDFDDTIAFTEYPYIKEPIPRAVDTINKLYDEGYGIIINTCREGVALADAILWMNWQQVKRDYINCNFPHKIEHFRADCRKISADMYIDDKNIGVDVMDWIQIYDQVIAKTNKIYKLK